MSNKLHLKFGSTELLPVKHQTAQKTGLPVTITPTAIDKHKMGFTPINNYLCLLAEPSPPGQA